MKTTVTITRAHFKAGRRCTISFCPVALALKDAGVKDAIVNRWGRNWHVGIRGRAFELPEGAKKVAIAFDRRKRVRLPVTFDFTRARIPNMNSLTAKQATALEVAIGA